MTLPNFALAAFATECGASTPAVDVLHPSTAALPDDRCHCGNGVYIHDDGFSRGLCEECDANRCDTSDGMAHTSDGMAHGCPHGRTNHAAVYGPTSPLRQFTHQPDAWDTPTIWSADPDRPAALLTRHQLPADGLGDALWALIVAAVEGAGR